MQNAKIIRLLSCLSGYEIREFRKFVCSPYHNNRKIVIKFYDVLKEYYPDFESVSGEEIYSRVFPGKKFNNEELTKLSSFLFKLGRNFLAVSQFKESSFYYNKLLLESLDQHNADSFFETEYEKALKRLNNGKMHNQFFLLKGMMEVLKIDYSIKVNKQKEIAFNVIKNAEYDIFHLLVKLAIRYTDMLANKNAYNYNFSNTVAEFFINNFNFDSFIKNLKNEKIQYYDFILYYYYQFKAFSELDNEHYYNLLRESTFKDFDELEDLEMANRYIRLFGYCITQIRRGNLNFLNDCFELHKTAYENQINKSIVSEDFIYPVFFRNFVIYGLAAKEYTYIENFIAQSGSKLNMEYRDDLVNVSSAMLQFEKKRYTDVLELLNKVKYSYPGCQIDTKTIYVKTFYETGDYESLVTLVDSFRHFLKRDRTISDVYRDQNISFLNYIGKLSKLKLNINDDIYELQKIIKEDIKVDPIQKIWLIETAEKLLA